MSRKGNLAASVGAISMACCHYASVAAPPNIKNKIKIST